MFLTSGILFVALIRLMFLPFGVMSYALSLTCVSILDYMIGTSAAIVDIILTVLIGCTIWKTAEDTKEGSDDSRRLAYFIFLTEFVITVAVTIIITIIAKAEFDKRYEAAELHQKKRR